MEKIEDSIIQILSSWNPLNLSLNSAFIEYTRYVNQIIKDPDSLEKIINDLGKSSLKIESEKDKNEILEVLNKINKLLFNKRAYCAFCGYSVIMKSKNSAEITIEYGSEGCIQDAYIHIKCLNEHVHKNFMVLDQEDED